MDTQARTRCCPLCKEEIHWEAIKCKHCKTVLVNGGPMEGATDQSTSNPGTLWLPIPSLCLGIFAFLASIGSDAGTIDNDTFIGGIIFSFAAIILGSISISKQSKGKGMAIAGIVLGAIGFLIFLGLQA